MSTKVTVNQSKSVRVLGMITAIVGVFLLVAGGVAYAFVSSYLADENIAVADDAAMFAGKTVAGPFTAYAQADIINTHALAGSNGMTYAEIGDVQSEKKAEIATLEESGMAEGDAEFDAAQEELAQISAQRTSVMNGSFLRASLFTSVVSFGVSALVMAVGVLFALVGFALVKVAGGPAVITETTSATGNTEPVATV